MSSPLPILTVEEFTALALLALTIWREASGEAWIAKLGVAWVICNRAKNPGWWGRDPVGVVSAKAQFTSMVPPDGVNDPNLRRWPRPEDQSWLDSVQAAKAALDNDGTDPTGGACYYHSYPLTSPKVPDWAKKFHHTADLGRLHFYKV